MLPKKKDYTLMIVFGIIGYLFVVLLSFHAGMAMRADKSLTALTALSVALSSFTAGPLDCFPIVSESWSVLQAFSLIYMMAIAFFIFDAQRNRRDAAGKEKGAAGWNSPDSTYKKKYTYPPNSTETYEPTKEEREANYETGNMILSKNVYLNMNTRQTRVNNNVLILGASGKGKSRFVVKPNILQANCSYVITDPSGELLESTGHFLKNQGYKLKIFNLCDMTKSNTYNPFNYMRDDAGVMMLINCLIKNTNPKDGGGGDPFWEKSETALLQALIFYLIKYCPQSEQNFVSVMKLLNEAEVNESNPNAKSPLDIRFEALEKLDPGSIALKQYKIFKQGAGKTLKSILISVCVRLSHFNIPQIANLTSTDNLDLKTLGDEKQALFVIIPAADDTYNYLVSMMYYQLFEALYYHAENECKGKRLPIHVRFILDEFANIGQIPQFPQKLSTMRKYEISCTIIIQSICQLKSMYSDDYETLMGNCDSTIFLGSPEMSNLEYISKVLGDATIVVRNNSRNEGAKGGGSSLSYNRDQRNLMTPNEIYNMDDQHCIILISGMRPFYDFKFPLETHPNFKHSADGDGELFNYRKYDEFNLSSKLQASYQNPVNIDANQVKELIEDAKKPAIKGQLIEDMFSELAEECGDEDLLDDIYNSTIGADSIEKYIHFDVNLMDNEIPDEFPDDDIFLVDQTT